MKKYNRATYTVIEAVHKVRRIIHPFSTTSLCASSPVWVDAALQLSERDLRVMERIARTQEKLTILAAC